MSGGKPLHEVASGLVRGLDLLREQLCAVDSEEKVKALLDSMDEPTPTQVVRLEVIARFVPMAMEAWVRKAIVTGVARLPGAKMGRKSIPDSEKLAICDEVAALSRKGYTLAAAKRRVAQRRDSTVRTIDRVWSRRTEYTIDMDAERVQTMIGHLFHPQANEEAQQFEGPGGDVAP